MSIAFQNPSIVANLGQALSLSQLVAVTAGVGNPTYLVLNGFDRNEYAAGSSGRTGTFSGNAHTLGFATLSGDMRGAGIVFSYSAASGRYYNTTYGFLDQLTYTASTSIGDVTGLSLFGTSNAALASNYAANAISLAQRDAGGYLGTLTVVSGEHGATVPTQATPLSIAAVAQSFVGAAWNKDGCWTLACTISAEAGASLPVQSAVTMAGTANGEWIVSYNGPAGSTGDWASSVRTGDMIAFVTAAGGGHITTCVSGSGSSAMLVDNITYVDSSGAIINGAGDGSAADVLVSAPHAASQEWSGVSAGSVVIYRLDTPVITASATPATLQAGASATLAGLCSVADPAGRAITSFQAYTANASGALAVNGVLVDAVSINNAVTASSLSQITFQESDQPAVDSITVRAFNGTYWGDWTTITVDADVSSAKAAQAAGTVSIYRFFDASDGTHFYTASATEAQTIAATRTDLLSEGVGLTGYTTDDASASRAAVYRFFDVSNGTHFYTADASEVNSLRSTEATTMIFENAAFYEDLTPQAGDTAVYRFFDTAHGTHLYTQSASEKASIVATRPDLVSEGIAFYAPSAG